MNWIEYEQNAESRGYKAICGVDEAGRGPLAGPVCAAAVILPPDTIIIVLLFYLINRVIQFYREAETAPEVNV